MNTDANNDNSLFESPSPFADLPARSVVGILATGLATAIVTFILSHILDNYIIGPALCRSASDVACVSSDVTSLHIAAVISSLLGVVMLVNSSVYRPLLVALAVLISSWNFYITLLPFAWYWMLCLLIVFNILGYLAFSWILRIYNLIIALVLSSLLVIGLLFVSSL